MRISVTDHCNLRCMYCTSYQAPRLRHEDILRYEEIERIVRQAAGLGIDSLRLTGGEPLMRPHLKNLVQLLREIDGIRDISMTTNGITLAEHVKALKQAGLDRVNISLDSLKEDKFRCMTGRGDLRDALKGIEAARSGGLEPVKINTVVLAGINDDEITEFAARTISDAWNVRFIEYMPFACSNGASGNFNNNKTVSDSTIKAIITDKFGALEPVMPSVGNGPAKYYRLAGSEGSIGFIGAVTDCFCQLCNRMRLTADGRLRPCLLKDDEIDVKTPLRIGVSDEELRNLISQAAALKHEKHRLNQHILPAGRQMWQIGG